MKAMVCSGLMLWGSCGCGSSQSNRHCGGEVGHDQLAISRMLSMHGQAVGLMPANLASAGSSQQRVLEDPHSGIFEVAEVSAFTQEIDHLSKDRSNQRGRKVVEGQAADHVVETRLQIGLLDRGLVQEDLDVRIGPSKRTQDRLLKVSAEVRIDFHDLEGIARAE